MRATPADHPLMRAMFGDHIASQLIVGMGHRLRPLGPVVTAACEYGRGVNEAYDDPMNDYAGFTPPGPSPEQMRVALDGIAAEHGWVDWAAVEAELKAAVSARWLHFNLTF